VCLVQRFLCPRCKKTFTQLPPFLLPFKHYVVSEIERVLRHLWDGGTYDQSPSLADGSTVKRWWKEFSQDMPQWVGLLEAIIYAFTQQFSSLINYFDPLKRLEEALARLPALPSHWSIITRTLWWLAKTHPL
jgi:hypothetical protein